MQMPPAFFFYECVRHAHARDCTGWASHRRFGRGHPCHFEAFVLFDMRLGGDGNLCEGSWVSNSGMTCSLHRMSGTCDLLLLSYFCVYTWTLPCRRFLGTLDQTRRTNRFFFSVFWTYTYEYSCRYVYCCSYCSFWVSPSSSISNLYSERKKERQSIDTIM